jgi:tripartite-type tricarboxylate transporter receptor subunit TctC
MDFTCKPLALGLASAALIAAPLTASAQDFYAGKTISIVVGFTPGGGYDSYARLASRFLPAHLPGKPNVVVQNMPGAGSLVSVRALDATLPKDGTQVVIFNPGIVTQSIVDPKSVGVDFRKVAWVLAATPDFRVCYGFGDKGVKSWDDMMKSQKFILGSTAKGSGNYINGAIMRILFNAPVQQVLGFPGSAEQRLAIERGELDGDCGSVSSIPPEWIQSGKANMFVRFLKQRPPEIPASVPLIEDFAKTQEQKDVLAVLSGGDELGRPFIMSQQVPADRLAIMRKAFEDTFKDPALLDAAKKEQLTIAPISGVEAQETVAKMGGVSPAVAEKAKAIYD